MLIQLQNQTRFYNCLKNIEFETKIPCLSILDISYSLDLPKKISFLKSMPSHLVKLKFSCKKKIQIWYKNTLFKGVFLSPNFKNIFSYLKSRLLSSSNFKILWKTKKSSSLGPIITCLCIFRHKFEKEILSGLRSQPLHISKFKIFSKTRKSKHGAKNTLFELFKL